MIGDRIRMVRAEKLDPTADQEYEAVSDKASRLEMQIRDLQGFIDEAPQIAEERKQEMRVTLPPPEDEDEFPAQVATVELEADSDDGEDMQERLGRRHLAAIKRERRKNFFIFVVSAAAVASFLYWVSKVVQ